MYTVLIKAFPKAYTIHAWNPFQLMQKNRFCMWATAQNDIQIRIINLTSVLFNFAAFCFKAKVTAVFASFLFCFRFFFVLFFASFHFRFTSDFYVLHWSVNMQKILHPLPFILLRSENDSAPYFFFFSPSLASLRSWFFHPASQS